MGPHWTCGSISVPSERKVRAVSDGAVGRASAWVGHFSHWVAWIGRPASPAKAAQRGAGGLRATVITGGRLRVGDLVVARGHERPACHDEIADAQAPTGD